MPFSTILTALLFSITSAHAARLSVSIQPSPQLLNPSSLPPSTHAVLLGPPGTRYDVPLRRNNTFLFPDLPEAHYLLTVHSRDHFFPPLRVDVTRSETEGEQTISAWQTFRGHEWSNKGPLFGSGQGQLEVQVRALGQKHFYQQRAGFSVVAFLKSPMILMALLSVVMIFGLPYLMENMDPETKKEFEEIQSKSSLTGSNGAANQIQNFDLAGWMAGKSSGTSTPSSGGGGAKKR